MGSKLKQSSLSKIEHLDSVCSQLIEQRAIINKEIRNLKATAIEKLKNIRNKHLKPNASQISDEYDIKFENKSDATDDVHNLNNVLLPNIAQNDFSTMIGLLHWREKFMNCVYKRIHDLESRALTTSSTDYLHSLTEIKELQIIFANDRLAYFFNKFVSLCNEVFNDCCLAYQAILEYTAEIGSPIITDLRGIKLLNSVLNGKTMQNEQSDVDSAQNQLEIVVDFVQSLPDREIVIMQVARYLSLSLPFRSFILGTKRRKYKNVQFDNDEDENEEEEMFGGGSKNGKHLVKIDGFVMNKIREWMGSILQIYGDNAFNSVRIALENDVVAQVRPSNAARLIVNCVYGLDVSW